MKLGRTRKNWNVIVNRIGTIGFGSVRFDIIWNQFGSVRFGSWRDSIRFGSVRPTFFKLWFGSIRFVRVEPNRTELSNIRFGFGLCGKNHYWKHRWSGTKLIDQPYWSWIEFSEAFIYIARLTHSKGSNIHFSGPTTPLLPDDPPRKYHHSIQN